MLASSKEAIQAQMNKVEGSILSQLYKNHIQVGAEPWLAFILGAVGRSWVDKHRGQASILNHTPHKEPSSKRGLNSYQERHTDGGAHRSMGSEGTWGNQQT